jgi:hypothetical protein
VSVYSQRSEQTFPAKFSNGGGSDVRTPAHERVDRVTDWNLNEAGNPGAIALAKRLGFLGSRSRSVRSQQSLASAQRPGIAVSIAGRGTAGTNRHR